MSQPPKNDRAPARHAGREPDGVRRLQKGADGQRIAKLLARAGIASRREIERMIDARRIAIDGLAIETPATIVSSLRGVTVDGKPVAAPAPTRLFLYHKPAGLLTTERDPKGRATIYDKLPADLPRVVPVGRLDLNTEGLLLLTTDGEFKRQLELPSTGVERSYRARAYGNVSQAQLEDLIEGVEIEGVRYGSIDANLERRTGTNSWIEMRLREGKNREVRRVLEYLGLQVSRLIRTGYGPFVLGDLPPGELGEVRQHDLVEFRKTLKSALKSPSPPVGERLESGVARRPDDKSRPPGRRGRSSNSPESTLPRKGGGKR
ncbi:MAG TPA: pseudouridine synthase [Sphingomonas sp.]|nr:pseudouridine synthase [Sphingomonas sp.]